MTTNSHIIEEVLGPSAIDYVRSQLECGHSLASAMLNRLLMLAGTASTFVAPGNSVAALEDFHSGGKLKQEPATIRTANSTLPSLPT
jgi:hypothetical protein